MSIRKIIDAKQNGKKVWLKGHAQATFMSDGSTVEDAINSIEIPSLDEYITETELNDKGFLTEHQDISGKQDTLVSGTNIKTINGESVLGSGDISISSIKWSILKKPVPTVGDIVYMADGSLKFKSPSQWDNSLGTPVGIIMIEEGYAPDGKIRILSLGVLDGYQWGPERTEPFGPGVDSPAPNYTNVVVYYNNGEEQSENGYSWTPSDVFTGEQSYGDPLAFYHDIADIEGGVTPSPYFDGKLHPAYTKVSEYGINALSDFNGLSNTQVLVSAGSEYEAANACWNYKDAANSNLQWYLPSLGELCFLMARLGTIDKSLNTIGIDSIFQPDVYMKYFSSTEYIDGWDQFFEEGVWCLDCSTGGVTWETKGYYEGMLTRPVAMIDSF
jgi:hypothetical protein